ncbi:MAG: sulfatase-like hydrolase/transferase [Bacteroidia bacterium]|nr:sulfatase-like hydrolase/transferase [Bacteroidia bacterium]
MNLSLTANVIGISSLILGQCSHYPAKFPVSKIKPNLLFIWTDEQQPGTIGAYGNSIIKTPNLDRLAGESFVFKYAYVTQPVSTPSRSSVMTGLYPHTTGCLTNNIPLADSINCLPGLLDDPVYSTGYMGKWHLGNEVFPQKGFKTWISMEDGYSKFFSKGKDKNSRSSYFHWLIEKEYKPDSKDNKFSRDFASELPIELCKPKFLEEKACEFLEQNKNNPFILYINFLEPHMPFSGPLNNMYNPEDVSIPESFNDPLEENEPLSYKLKRESAMKSYGKTEDDFRKLIARYWGLASQVDLSVGGILNKLKELGLDTNTIVIFTSDHGDMMGAHRMVAKSVMYQEAVRIPLMIKIPSIKASPRIIENQVSQIDIIPTILDLMNGERKSKLQGKSLLPLISGEITEEDYVFIEWNNDKIEDNVAIKKNKPGSEEEITRAQRSITRTAIAPDGWKLCLSDLDHSQLFDLNSDPYEKTNLFTQPEHRDKIVFLANKIYEWQKLTGDSVVIPVISTLKY